MTRRLYDLLSRHFIWQVNINIWQVNIIIWQVMAEICHHNYQIIKHIFKICLHLSIIHALLKLKHLTHKKKIAMRIWILYKAHRQKRIAGLFILLQSAPGKPITKYWTGVACLLGKLSQYLCLFACLIYNVDNNDERGFVMIWSKALAQ